MISEIAVVLPFIYCSKGERRLISQALTALMRDLKIPKPHLMTKKNPAVWCVEGHVSGTGLNVMDVGKNKDVTEKRDLDIKRQRNPEEQWASCPSKKAFS